MEIAVWISALTSAFAVGFIMPAYLDTCRVRKELFEKIKEFDNITKVASEANLSFANKILQLEEKISNLEFARQANTFKK